MKQYADEEWDEGMKMYEAKYVEIQVWQERRVQKVAQNVLKDILVLKFLKSDKIGKMLSMAKNAHTLRHKDTMVTR